MCNGRSDFDVSCCNVGCKFNAIRNNDVFSRSKNLLHCENRTGFSRIPVRMRTVRRQLLPD